MHVRATRRGIARLTLTALIVGSLAATGTASARADDNTTVEPAELIHVIPLPAQEYPGHSTWEAATVGRDGTLVIKRQDGLFDLLRPDAEVLERSAARGGCNVGYAPESLEVGADGTVYTVCSGGASPTVNVTPAGQATPTVSLAYGWNGPTAAWPSDPTPAPDGSLYFRLTTDNKASVWRLAAGARTALRLDWTPPSTARLLAVDRRGHLYLDTGSEVAEIEPGKGAVVRRLPGGQPQLRIADDGAVVLRTYVEAPTYDYVLTRFPPGSTAGDVLMTDDSEYPFAVAPDGRVATIRGTWESQGPQYRLSVWEPGSTAPGAPILLTGRVDALAFTPDGQVRAHSTYMVEETTGTLTTEPPQPPRLVPIGEDRNGTWTATWQVIPGDHPAVPTTYTVAEERHEPPFDPRGSRLNPAEAPVVTATATGRTADGRVVTSAPTRAVLTRRVMPYPSGPPILGSGIPVNTRLLTGAPEGARVLSGTLPPGMSLDSRGKLYGTPGRGGTYSFWMSYRRAEGLYGYGERSTVASQFTIFVTSGPTILQPMPHTSLPRHWSVLAFDTSGNRLTTVLSPSYQSFDDPIEVDLLTGIGSLDDSLAPLRFDRNSGEWTRGGWMNPGFHIAEMTGTEPVVARFRSGRSAAYFVVVRPEGAPTTGSDLWVHLDGPADVTPGQTVTLFLAGGNTGPQTATDVTVGVRMPTGIALLGTTCNGTDIAAGRMIVRIDRLTSEQSRQCTITVRAPSGPVGGAAVIDAGIAAAGNDPITVNNTASLRVGLRRP